MQSDPPIHTTLIDLICAERITNPLYKSDFQNGVNWMIDRAIVLDARLRRQNRTPESLLDPDMSAQDMRLHMGEMTAQEMRTARAAIRWANSVMGGATPELADARVEASEAQGSVACAMEVTPPARRLMSF